MDILVLCGGLSAERDVSIAGGAMAAAALRRRGHRTALADLFFGYPHPYNDASEIFTNENAVEQPRIGETAPDLAALRSGRADNSRIGGNIIDICRASEAVFIALHGEDGEDGKIQALFDLHGIKYTGTGPLGSTLAMNKDIAKQLLTQNNVLTPRGIIVRRDCGEPCNIGFPCAVKPCSGGSSVGASIVLSASEYRAALELAFEYGDEVVVEQFIAGRECNVGVISGKALPVIEIRTKSGFFDYKNKYQSGMAEEICPAELPPETTKKLQRAAERVFEILKFDVYGRMDFIVDNTGGIWCLEGNTLPGITATSLLPQEAAAAGMSYDDLIETIVFESLKKYGGNQ